MAITFRLLGLGATAMFAIQHNWFAILWVIVALIQHERAEMIGRWNR